MSIKEEIPQPLPPKNERIKTYTVDYLVQHEGKWCFERVHYTREYSMILRIWKPREDLTRKEYIDLESQGIKKTQRLNVLIFREGLDRYLKPIFVYVKIVLEARISNSPEFINYYLKVDKGHRTRRKWVRGCFILSDLEKGTGQILSFQSPWIQRVGKELIVPQKEAERMIENCEIADLVEEDSRTGKFSSRKVVYNKVL